MPWNDDVLYLMDAEEDIESKIAQTLCSSFDNLACDVMPYGSILDFRHAWIKPRPAQRGLLAKAATTIIDAAFPDHALLIVKAHPLEYEGQMPDDAPIETGLASRQRAMVRHYHRIFGVEPLPCPHGQEGWLWRLHPKLRTQTKLKPIHSSDPRPGRQRSRSAQTVCSRASGPVSGTGAPAKPFVRSKWKHSPAQEPSLETPAIARKRPQERGRYLLCVDEMSSGGFRIEECERVAGGRGGEAVPSSASSKGRRKGDDGRCTGHCRTTSAVGAHWHRLLSIRLFFSTESI